MCDERERRGREREKEFELNCITLLRWKWAAKIIERLMGFFEAQRVAKIRRPIRISRTWTTDLWSYGGKCDGGVKSPHGAL